MIPQDQIRLPRPLAPDLKSFSKRIKQIQEEAWYTNHGPFHEELRQRLTDRMRCDNLTLFANGTLALICGLKALQLTGDVLTTPFTFPATVHALHWANLRPIFCDIDPKTLNINPDCLQERLTPQTSAILAVHVFGSPCKCEKLEIFARENGLKLIIDAAHAFDLLIKGKPISDYGDISMFSFHATKLFHTAEGGCLVYKDSSLVEKLHLLQNFGIPSEDALQSDGTNAKLSELHAALGLGVLEKLEEERRKRSLVDKHYREAFDGIPGLSCLPEVDEDIVPPLQYFVLRINEGRFGHSRDKIHASLRRGGILARKYFYPSCSDCPEYQDLPGASSLPETRVAVSETHSLPMYGTLHTRELDRIVDFVLARN